MVQVLDRDKWEDEVIGQITINLDEIGTDEEIGGWYAVDSDDATTLGVIQLRVLLSSHPNLSDDSKAWLLSDYDVLQITQTANALSIDCSDREMKRSRKADRARLLWRADELMDRAFRTLDVDAGGSINAEELAVIMALVPTPGNLHVIKTLQVTPGCGPIDDLFPGAGR